MSKDSLVRELDPCREPSFGFICSLGSSKNGDNATQAQLLAFGTY